MDEVERIKRERAQFSCLGMGCQTILMIAGVVALILVARAVAPSQSLRPVLGMEGHAVIPEEARHVRIGDREGPSMIGDDIDRSGHRSQQVAAPRPQIQESDATGDARIRGQRLSADRRPPPGRLTAARAHLPPGAPRSPT